MTRSLVVLSFSAAALLLAAGPASARAVRVNQIPNGQEFSCANCHVSAAGGGDLNPFGEDVDQNLDVAGAQGVVQWGNIYDLDSDDDGMTNGEELGDPDGTWMQGDDDPDGDITNPGVAPGDADGGTNGAGGDGLPFGFCGANTVVSDAAPGASLALLLFGALAFVHRRR